MGLCLSANPFLLVDHPTGNEAIYFWERSLV